MCERFVHDGTRASVRLVYIKVSKHPFPLEPLWARVLVHGTERHRCALEPTEPLGAFQHHALIKRVLLLLVFHIVVLVPIIQ